MKHTLPTNKKSYILLDNSYTKLRPLYRRNVDIAWLMVESMHAHGSLQINYIIDILARIGHLPLLCNPTYTVNIIKNSTYRHMLNLSHQCSLEECHFLSKNLATTGWAKQSSRLNSIILSIDSSFPLAKMERVKHS